MLVLTRKIGEKIVIGNSIELTVLSYDRGLVRVGIEAPKNITVHRKEIQDRIIELNKQAASTEVRALREYLAGNSLLGTGDAAHSDEKE